jgi:hypothetical protein
LSLLFFSFGQLLLLICKLDAAPPGWRLSLPLLLSSAAARGLRGRETRGRGEETESPAFASIPSWLPFAWLAETVHWLSAVFTCFSLSEGIVGTQNFSLMDTDWKF